MISTKLFRDLSVFIENMALNAYVLWEGGLIVKVGDFCIFLKAVKES